MDEREANIDLLFRNGLKDYEVLPPQDVWDNIQPVAKKKEMPFIFLRAAAIITVVASLSFIAYMLSRDTSINNGGIASLTISQSDPIHIQALQSVLVRQTNTITEDIPDNAEVISKMTVSEAEGPFSSYSDSEQPNEENILASDDKALELTNKLALADRSTEVSNITKPFTEKKEIVMPAFTASTPVFYPEVKQVPAERWSIAAMASPTYFSEFGSKGLEGSVHSSEKPAVSYSGGFAVSYKINKRFSVQTGLYYASNGQKINGISSYAGFGKYYYTKGSSNFEVLTSSGPVLTSNPDVFLVDNTTMDRVQTAYSADVFDPNKASLDNISNTIVQNFNYLEMPLMLKYKIIDKILDINIIGGISYDILLNNSVYARTEGGKYKVGETQGLSNLNLSSSLGMGMEYSLSRKISLNLEPTFRYFLNPLNELANPALHPYSFGVFSGFSYRF